MPIQNSGGGVSRSVSRLGNPPASVVAAAKPAGGGSVTPVSGKSVGSGLNSPSLNPSLAEEFSGGLNAQSMNPAARKPAGGGAKAKTAAAIKPNAPIRPPSANGNGGGVNPSIQSINASGANTRSANTANGNLNLK